jgi:hypothetical protein
MADSTEILELRKFSATSLDATRTAWQRQLKTHSRDLIASEYQRILGWAGCHISYGAAQDTYAYGIFDKNSGEADAVAEVIYSKAGARWLKLLDLHLCPSVDLSFATQDIDIRRLTAIFTAAVIGSMRLTSTAHPTKVLKLYGRSGTLLAFLKGVGTYIESNIKVSGIKVSIEGRWLVFKV